MTTQRQLALAAALTATATATHPAPIQLAWDYPTANDASEFRLYCGPSPGAYAPAPVATIPRDQRAATITMPNGQRQYCALAAADGTSESTKSNEVSFVPRLETPTKLRITTTDQPDRDLELDIHAT